MEKRIIDGYEIDPELLNRMYFDIRATERKNLSREVSKRSSDKNMVTSIEKIIEKGLKGSGKGEK